MLRRGGDSGQAVVIALGILMVLAVIPVTLVDQSTAVLGQGTQAINRHAADAAVTAGLNDYLDLLANNPDYIIYSASNEPTPPNPAFTGWTPVPGPALDPPEWFRYTPDTSVAGATGIIRLTVSGRAGNPSNPGLEAVRSARFGVRRSSYLDFVYFTDYEIGDPANQGNAEYSDYCLYHLDQANPFTGGTGPDTSSFDGGTGNCDFIEFVSSDVLNGPVHSNDGFRICGDASFRSTVTSSVFPSGTPGQRWVSECNGTAPNWAVNGSPVYVPDISMPPSDTTLAAEAAPPATGCLYTGPTTVHFHDNGTMDVTSPLSRATNGCGTGNGLAQPADGVIYVQNVPASPSDPNYSSTATCSAHANTYTGVTGCNGDLEVGDAQAANGGVKGQLTLAAQNDVIIDGDLVYQGGLTGTDVLGLIAGNYIEVNHPVTGSNDNTACTEGAAPTGTAAQIAAETAPACDLVSPVIDAAVLSVAHSFLVNNAGTGSPLGNLTVNGSIAQEFRGAVGTDRSGTIVTGYAKAYTYDPRLEYLAPPYFLDPTSSNYEVVSFSQLTPQYPA